MESVKHCSRCLAMGRSATASSLMSGKPGKAARPGRTLGEGVKATWTTGRHPAGDPGLWTQAAHGINGDPADTWSLTGAPVWLGTESACRAQGALFSLHLSGSILFSKQIVHRSLHFPPRYHLSK